MWKTIGYTILVALATLGVLFIILMLMPDDSDADIVTESVTDMITDEVDTIAAGNAEDTVTQTDTGNAADAEDADDAGIDSEAGEADEPDTAETESHDDPAGDTVPVNIPADALSEQPIRFKTVTLDGQKITQDIFADYDLTVVYVWGTYCSNCIREMGEYASLYESLPSNVNLVGIVCDVYDGIDNNVSDAHEILDGAQAGFMNLRLSDDLYNVTGDLQFIPSSFFVNSEGRIIGGKLDGANVYTTMEKLGSFIDQNL